MGSPTGEMKRPLVRLLGIAVVIPVLATLLSAVLLTAWRADLPEQVVTHWGPGGAPDGFTSVTGLLWTVIVAGIVLTVVAVVAATICQEYVLCASVISGVGALSAFLAALTLSLSGIQRGVDDVSTVGLPWWSLVVALAAGVACGVGVYRLVPTWSTPAVVADPASPMAIGSTERMVWTRSVMSGGIALALMIVGVVMCVAAVVLSGQWVFLVLAATVAAVAVLMYGIRVTVDPQALTIRSIAGWPRIVVPVSEIATVREVRVSAIKDFGGYGYRIGFRGEMKGAKGFVLKSGDGILVERFDGGRQIVVVGDADTGVRLLEAYRLRAQRAA